MGVCLRFATQLPNYLLFCAASFFFYMMLWKLTRMLSSVLHDKKVIAAGLSTQFKAVRIAVWLVWHVFPMVWLLGATGSISIFHEHVGYLAGDLCAKYLLLFVYLSHVNSR